MPWFKVDDSLSMHPKVLAAGNGAMGLWVRAGSWSMQMLTGGFVPEVVARQLGNKTQADRLVEVGLWERLPTGYAFHQWGQRQPDADKVKQARDAESSAGSFGAHRRWHIGRNVADPDCPFCKEGK